MNNSNNSNNSQINYLTDRLSNLILLDIISKIDNNVDMICFLLTCKRLYHSIGQQSNKSIRFKGLAYFDKLQPNSLNEWLVGRLPNCLPTFRQIVQNSLSNQMVLVNRLDTFAKCKELVNVYHMYYEDDSSNTDADKDDDNSTDRNNNNSNDNDNDIKIDSDTNSNSSSDDIAYHYEGEMEQVQNVLVTVEDSTIESHPKIPSSTKSLIIHYNNDNFYAPPPNYIPPSVKDVVFHCEQFQCDQDFIPDTVESLEMNTNRLSGNVKLPSKLKSLVWKHNHSSYRNLSLDMIPFHNLSSLTTLKINIADYGNGVVVLPPTLTSLDLTFSDIIPDNLLQPLKSLTNLRIDGEHITNINLQSQTCLKSLFLEEDFYVNLPVTSTIVNLKVYGSVDFIPQSLESLQIGSDHLIEQYQVNPNPLPATLRHLGIIVYHSSLSTSMIPDGVTSLVLDIGSSEQVELDGLIPISVEKLQLTGLFGWFGQATLSTLPNSIKSLKWTDNHDYRTISFSFPEHLETLEWMPGKIENVSYPSSLTSLSIEIPPHSGKIEFSLSKNHMINKNGMFLPPNIKYLTFICSALTNDVSFRLDEIIKQTNVQELTIQINEDPDDDFNFQIYEYKWATFSIRRLLDDKNPQVLIVDNQSMFGGFITLPSSSSSQSSPLYLRYLKSGACPTWGLSI
ncbi:hypothetical protein DFA_10254 [Cavenderia fasciculata]|uniref:FNIP repeat-containing protein n=1 Tax=Cavenderia fasciculata TaxID=261658 RepID=F4Q9Q0_CACFS|nr:uncharacterized protein DFA_10254 [Cavenderia fasciculata]EGG15419.1 hypothetical protein DFA_10254 [Cavenderia fasciculata]|eukprot:XP_004354161.1 hypothetical protein DFA_10254 [Cavenderia fasciculata]